MSTAPRLCEWCQDPIPSKARKDATTCSKACRQAKQRFRVAPAPPKCGPPLRLAYADPPYPGLSKRYYEEHPAFGGEVDHVALVRRLMAEYPDGWALSTGSPALLYVGSICRDVIPPASLPELRVAIWIKGSRHGVSNRPRDAYEPVFVFGGRPRRLDIGEHLDNVLLWGGRQHSHPDALVGMKPPPFSEWMFRQLGAQQGDTLDDLFPGSRAVERAWKLYVGEPVVEPVQRAMFPDPEFLEARQETSRLNEAALRLEQALADPTPRA